MTLQPSQPESTAQAPKRRGRPPKTKVQIQAPISAAPAIVQAKPKVVAWKDIPPEKREILVRPSAFCRVVEGMSLTDRQCEIMDDFGPMGSRVAVRTCNESGKTSRIIAGLILWHGSVFPLGTAISTSGSWLQITHQLVPHLKRYAHKHPKWIFNATDISNAGRPLWLGFSTNDAGRAEGFHGEPTAPLLALVDEAKSVPDEIFTAIDDRCNPQRYGLLSSPGYASGEFYRAHTSNSQLYKTHKLTAYECPHIAADTIERRIKKWGADHPLVKSMIFAEFMEFIEDALLTLADWENCIEHAPDRAGIERHAFCDFAGKGGDNNVFAARLGNEVWIEDYWNQRTEMESVGHYVTLFNKLKREYGFQPHEISGDADGIGGPMCDRLNEVGWPINRFHGGSAALESTHYFNRISEVWFTGAEKIKKRQIIIRDRSNEELRGQIMSRKRKEPSNGKLQIEPKKEMFARGLPSPDLADAVLGAMATGFSNRSMNVIRKDPLWATDNDDMGVDANLLAGMDAGF